MNRKRIIYVISAPSGTGKTTICNRILQLDDNLKLSVSYTSRQPKKGEKNGVDYHFVSKETFKKMIDEGKFVEWAEVYGNYYGTPWEVFENTDNGSDLLLEIDVQGGKSISEKYKDAVMIFILPPSIEELRNRLIKRNRDSIEEIERRIRIVKKEIEYMKYYNYIVVNDDLEKAVENVMYIVKSARFHKNFVLDYYMKNFLGEEK